ncbi:uncharacterized protein LOC128547368 [Mercenaria mercenaria]|uniref:uncharacterized protein LOC128547368 n=1 Tax=Mercenaria mercenaria TaxID=6596 RepID=UPI00234F98B9|nr:uncharacterized protein LOC128547368 [Mercenaria mercenaria]
MEETESAKVYQDDLHSRTASLSDEDSPTTAVENASLLYYLFLHYHCKCNMDVIKMCRHASSFYDDIVKLMPFETINHIVGSAAEGLLISGISDFDCMVSDKSEICCDEDCIEDINHTDYSKVLIAHRRHASPGYTLVLDLNDYFVNDVSISKTYGELRTEINELVAARKVQTIALSGKDYIEQYVFFKGIPTHGPANCLKLSEMNVPLMTQMFSDLMTGEDCVTAISFICNDILRNWLNRKRIQGWPSEVLKRQISETQSHVVPVGRKGSKFEKFEWRICYTEAEIKLVHSLNKVQLMLYFKLKCFSKAVLKDVCSDITSYIIKNVIFWLAESVPNKYFQCKYFIPLFRATLVCLRKCVKNRYLPNYMIPERNLFDGKLESKEQAALVEVMSYWIEKCPILEGEKDLLPLYKDVVSRKTDKYLVLQVKLNDDMKKVSKLYNYCLSEMRELVQSDDLDTILADTRRLLGYTDTETCDLFKLDIDENDMSWYGCLKAISNTKIFKVLTSISHILLHGKPLKSKIDEKSMKEPELD